jgi:hypothetical protein
MKRIIIQYAGEISKFTQLELLLAKKIELVVNVANRMVSEHNIAKTDCPIKKVAGMEWDIQRSINSAQLTMKKPVFKLDVKDDALTISQEKNIFAVIKEQE